MQTLNLLSLFELTLRLVTFLERIGFSLVLFFIKGYEVFVLDSCLSSVLWLAAWLLPRLLLVLRSFFGLFLVASFIFLSLALVSFQLELIASTKIPWHDIFKRIYHYLSFEYLWNGGASGSISFLICLSLTNLQ